MKAILILAIISLAALANAATSSEFSTLWGAWKSIHNKVYESVEEDVKRFEIFVANYYRVIEFNAQSDEDGAKLALNKFADLTKKEFKSQMTGSAFVETDEEFIRQNTVEPEFEGTLPVSVDWVKEGAVTPVKDQGQCGSCWTFSTTGVIEGFNFLTTKTLLSFSEQQIVDCDRDQNQGCSGGWPYLAVEYAAKNGLELESDYPYKAVDQQCNYNADKAHKVVGGYKFVAPKSTLSLLTAIAASPVSVLIEADEDVFQLYKSGVIKNSCGAQIDHAVLATGYGLVGATPAFTVKNSWATVWGDQGYVYIGTDEKENEGQGVCGILYQPVIVTA